MNNNNFCLEFCDSKYQEKSYEVHLKEVKYQEKGGNKLWDQSKGTPS